MRFIQLQILCILATEERVKCWGKQLCNFSFFLVWEHNPGDDPGHGYFGLRSVFLMGGLCYKLGAQSLKDVGIGRERLMKHLFLVHYGKFRSQHIQYILELEPH